ncbi:MAG: 23S rRNA (adenine(2503)-C(2))-methyltransferase [Deltaproteobacteria bacterium RBG_16_54_11]|jgi:23S rRNA (adenine2503-C2)-methyltransferase|nr:MAG: 23S rRNA (adenine(2503)-C(2))-methyltransferase [Deltaproteobacteria bacterium RBG_16_54_11]
MSVNLKDLSLEELEALIAGLGKERYRARQIMRWLYGRGASSFEEMTDLAKELRAELSRTARISSLASLAEERSPDGTRKYLFGLEDGNQVESVLIPDDGRLTLCISTQAGCAMGCRFCLTGMGGFARDLTAGEILDQIVRVAGALEPGERLTNCVLMGMGEPLANYDRVQGALGIMASDLGFGLSRRRITLSTVGLIPQIKRLFAEGVPCRLAVSLNATTQKVRSFLMPISRRYPLSALLAACRALPLPPRERITFEYVLIQGVNDSDADAHRLTQILRGIRCKVNLIPFNECPGILFRRPQEKVVLRFQKVLMEAGYLTIIRESRGGAISAACGQLRGRITGS